MVGKLGRSEMNKPVWTAKVLTLFPEMFPGPLGCSLAGKALDKGLWSLETFDIRAYATGKNASVDSKPFGGGPGMVMRPDVIQAALEATCSKTRPIFLTPRGTQLGQQRIYRLAAETEITLLCGRFEGIDERILEAYDWEQISLGDFVLSGGEPAAIALIDACVRVLPGVVGNKNSLTEESFKEGLLEYPQYTQPFEWEGRKVPDLLLSGHHQKIREWRRGSAEQLTKKQRPDLWHKHLESLKLIKE